MHLKLHTIYSLARSTVRLDALVERALADGVDTLALTDSNALYGAVAFRDKCRQAGIKPVIGMTLTVRSPLHPTQNGREIVLLARDASGYRSLCRLSTQLQASAQRDMLLKIGVSWDDLLNNREGLIAIDAGRNGWLSHYLQTGDVTSAETYLTHFKTAFPSHGTIGLEIQSSQQHLIGRIATLAKQHALLVAALQPVHCLDSAERPTLKLLAAIDRNCPLADVPDHALPNGGDDSIDLHWQSPDQLRERFTAYPEAIDHAQHLLSLCEDPLPDGNPIWPKLPLPDNETPDAALAKLARAGLVEKFGNSHGRIERRLIHELRAIGRHGFAPLFLIVADIVRFARENAVPVATRGSVANSLVAYCLSITTVDPIEHDLLFERFLNPARRSLPDIDLDFCSRRRDRVLNYVRDTWGENHVALVSTINTFKRKSAVRETAKALDYDSAAIKRLTKLIPSSWHPDPRRRDKRGLAEFATSLTNARDRAVFESAAKIIGIPNHLSVHPGGVIITPGPLNDVVPLQWSPKGFHITQYDHSDIETIGLPKLDLLGIRALTVLADSAEWLQRHDPSFDLANIPLDDPTTAELLQRAETIGVFQCESHGAQRTMRNLNTRTVRDLAVANAFFKPGPALGGMANAFVRRYRGEEAVTFLHPSLEPILGSTSGVLIFQEQILRLAVEIAGLSWSQANQIRKGMSKFDASAIHALQEQFEQGCQRPKIGMSAEQAAALWGQIVPFAGYGFNQGHATAYADVSYRSAWMKAHHPAPFLAARLAHGGGYYAAAVYVAEARRLNIAVKPPHINHSQRRFALEMASGTPHAATSSNTAQRQATLWMGLGWVRDLRRQSVQAIIDNRPYASLRDLLLSIPLQAKEVQHLIQCGALDGLGPNPVGTGTNPVGTSRRGLLAEADDLLRGGAIQQMAFSLFDAPNEVAADTATERYRWEQHLLGFAVSVHPLDTVSAEAAPAGVVRIRDLKRVIGRTVTIGGTRLPSWDDSGFLFADRDGLIRCTIPKPLRDTLNKPPRWQAAWLTGTPQRDRSGNISFQVGTVRLTQ